MGISVKLEAFEGPLELLLHLIEKNKVNIYDIPIVEITEQYIRYIKEMQNRDMEVMSEFLVMAATLVKIKSKMLLPVQKEDEEPEDPRQELVERLLEYKMYRYISGELKERQKDAGRVLFRESSVPEEIAGCKEEINVNELLSGLTLEKLNAIFHSIMKKKEDKIDPIRSKFGKIEKEEISLSDKILSIDEYGKRHGTFRFRKLLEMQHKKMDVIVTFLGVLELIKVGRITVKQENIFEDIFITYHYDTEALSLEELSFS